MFRQGMKKMDISSTIILGYLAFINLAAFAMFGLDKRKARRGKSRISEASLFLVSLIGGVFGGILGMLAFRHKTRKAGFKAVMALILILNLAGYWYVMKYCNMFIW